MGRFVADPYVLTEKGREIKKKSEEFQRNIVSIYNNLDEMISKDYLSPEALEIAGKIKNKREMLEKMASVIDQYGNFTINSANRVLQNQDDIISTI